jgi:integrase
MIGYKRCKCRDGAGKEIGVGCPDLRRSDTSWNPRHGTWYGKADVAPGPDRKRVVLKQGGFATQDEMAKWSTAALHLLDIPDGGPDGHAERTEILRLIRESRKLKAALPDYDDMKRRYRHGTVFEAGSTGDYLLSWLDARKQDLSSRTLTGYESHIRRVFLSAFGDVPLSKLRQSHVVKAFLRIDARNAEITAARASEDPAVRASVAGERITGPTTKQRILATLRSARSWTRSRGSGCTRSTTSSPSGGLRRGEACGLRWPDVDLRRHHHPGPARAERLGGRRGRAEDRLLRLGARHQCRDGRRFPSMAQGAGRREARLGRGVGGHRARVHPRGRIRPAPGERDDGVRVAGLPRGTAADPAARSPSRRGYQFARPGLTPNVPACEPRNPDRR